MMFNYFKFNHGTFNQPAAKFTIITANIWDPVENKDGIWVKIAIPVTNWKEG